MKILLTSLMILLFFTGCCCPSGKISSSTDTTNTKTPIANTTVNTPIVKQNTPVPEQPLIQISAGQLIKEYQDNGVAADNKYKDRILEVTGIINSIDKDFSDTMYVTIGEEGTMFQYVQCYFSKDKNEKIASLKKGEKIIVKGKCDGKTINISLKNCEL